jgi:hypothetical protein
MRLEKETINIANKKEKVWPSVQYYISRVKVLNGISNQLLFSCYSYEKLILVITIYYLL